MAMSSPSSRSSGLPTRTAATRRSETPINLGTTGADGTEVANANLNGVAVGNYTYTASTSTQPGYLHGFIAFPQHQG